MIKVNHNEKENEITVISLTFSSLFEHSVSENMHLSNKNFI